MTDSFDEAVYKIKYSGDFTDLDQQFGRFDDQAAAAYLRENFIPRARVELMIKRIRGTTFKNRSNYVSTEALSMLLEEQDE